jgi:hypothetical protein
MNSFYKILFFILMISNLISCAKTDEEAIRSAVREARYFLTSSDCSNAKSVLDDVGEQKDNAEYVAVYSSAIACSSGYTDLGTAIGNLTSINTADQSTGAGFIKSFAAFASSNETAADQTTFTKLFEGIRYILEADSATPSTIGRLANFGTKAGNDLSMQALLMTTVAFGKWFAYYGNADSAGTKGAGSPAVNICIFSYTQADAVTYVNDLNPSGCSASGSEGHDELEGAVTAAVIKTRMCEGIYLYNNLVDILSNLSLSSNSSLGSLSAMATLFDSVNAAAVFAETTYVPDINSEVAYQNSIPIVRDVTSMSACEALNINRIQKYYAILMETLF